MDVKKITVFGAITVSVMILVIFGIAYGICLWFKIADQIASFGQAAINMAMIAVGYWLGSSSGSRGKDDVIAASNPPPKV